ncbi:MAG TPA: hypothetical protein VL240_05965 [Candidatus Binatia bacterium]|nr:hypothetical protein [Candidatus Binatia bacterium]
MKRQHGLILATVALLCGPMAWSQSFTNSALNPPGDSQQNGLPAGPQPLATYSAQNGSQDNPQDSSQQGSSGPQELFTHPEQLPPLNLFREVTSHTGVTFNTTVGDLVQYNSGGSGYSRYWSNLSSASAGVNIFQSRSDLVWNLTYTGGLSQSTAASYNYSNLNQFAAARIVWRFAKRWQLRIKDSFLYSDDPFQPFLTYLGNPAPNNPNPAIYLPQNVLEQNQGDVDLTYLLGKHDTLNFIGGESFQHYLRGAPSSLWNSTTYTGGAFYQHNFSARLAAGGGYTFTALDFGHGASRAGVQMLEGFAAYSFSPRTTLSGWVGPELTNTKDAVPIFCLGNGCLYEILHNHFVNLAEGATFRWQASSSNSFGLDFSHQVTNGGGVLGAVNYYQVAATYSRPLTRAWSLGAGYVYSSSLSVSGFRADQYLYGSQGTVGVSRRVFNDAWTLNAYYAFIHQSQNYFGLPATLTTSGLGFTLRYVWDHPFGR